MAITHLVLASPLEIFFLKWQIQLHNIFVAHISIFIRESLVYPKKFTHYLLPSTHSRGTVVNMHTHYVPQFLSDSVWCYMHVGLWWLLVHCLLLFYYCLVGQKSYNLLWYLAVIPIYIIMVYVYYLSLSLFLSSSTISGLLTRSHRTYHRHYLLIGWHAQSLTITCYFLLWICN